MTVAAEPFVEPIAARAAAAKGGASAAKKTPTKKAPAKHAAAPAPKSASHYFNQTKSTATKTASKTKEVGSKTKDVGTTVVNQVTGKAPSSHRKLLAVEYVVGSIVIFLQPLGVDATGVGNVSGDAATYAEAVEQFVAFTIVFFILSLLANAGDSGGSLSAGFGGLVVLAILLRPQNLTIASKIVPSGFRGKKGTTAVPQITSTLGPTTPTVTPAGNSSPNTYGRPIGQAGGVYNA